LYRLEVASRLMESLGLNEGAERLLNDYVSQEPRGIIAMAAYLGRAGQTERAFALLDEARKNQPATEILPVAMEALRRHPENITKERFQIVEDWAKAALQGESNLVQVKLLLAEIYDLQGRYPEVISIYRELLAGKEATAYQKALVKNNLAFILAVTKESPQATAEALSMTEEAIQILGPTSDLLDTRALAYLANGKTKEALADLQLAIADAPSTSKYFHQALAEKQVGNGEAAKAALAKVQEAPDEVKRFTPLEKQALTKLIAELQ
jgi:tetratricopeptide (TPR) repeat protein